MSDLLPGFADPVAGPQATFRAVLEAMARPGRVFRLPLAPSGPAPLSPAAAAVLLTLADAETPVWSDAGAAAAEWLRFHAGCPLVDGASGAAFVLATGTPPALGTLEPGSDEEPHRSATLVLQVAALEEGAGWRLTGPGIEAAHRLRVTGAPDGFPAAWAANRRRFPCGVDVVLCAGDRVAALPRSVAIAEG
ncbi:phosphonate C-P lyase system protein PhnH [Roseomonas sp. OT10]|uniref:phosphonate C-P lyase system protein PhnH n=1 Tax=Roseomonas cutis TaxID=2897332 RepID=UPI001E4B555C|nr:phosphonate C-P lyase system protein PhnH [Roseomonas sp. OT10]UFN48798.1 phosphonate C-P lyase system protein PhnH [Roseomonas sp. OT10]